MTINKTAPAFVIEVCPMVGTPSEGEWAVIPGTDTTEPDYESAARRVRSLYNSHGGMHSYRAVEPSRDGRVACWALVGEPVRGVGAPAPDREQRRAANNAAGKIEQAGIDALVRSWPAGYTITGDRKPGSGIPGFIADTMWTVTAPNGEKVGSCITDTRADVMRMYAREVHVHAFNLGVMS